jgi:1,4-alpha-glucan branching enzyme
MSTATSSGETDRMPDTIFVELNPMGTGDLPPVVAPSPLPDRMGATLHQNGCTFRVWAPFADEVFVAGDFTTPKWNDGKIPLRRDTDRQDGQGRNGHWSAWVANVAPGAQYKIVIRSPRSEGPIWKIDPYARAATSSGDDGNGIVMNPADFDWQGTESFDIANWNELVVYEIHVGTFYDKPGDPVGDFGRVIARLQHLEDLGVNAIKVMPAFEFMSEVSMGYNPALLFAVEQAYSRDKPFQELVRECHKRGIAVIVDVVYNHFGPEDLGSCLWQFDGWFTKYDGEHMGGIYFYDDWRARTDWGKKNRPDYGREEVRRFIRDNVVMWLDDYRCDGLRWDSTINIRNAHGKNNDPGSDLPHGWELMRLTNDEMKRRYPRRIAIAEDLQGNDWITREAQDWGAGFGSQWDNSFCHALYDVLTPVTDESRDMNRVKDALYRRIGDDAFHRVIYSESHDEVKDGKGRLPEKIHRGHADSWESKKRSTLAAALTLTAPGIPMLFMGQEFLEWGSWSDKTPLDWSKPDRFPGVLNLYRDLIKLRRNWYDNTRGLRGQHTNVFHVNYDAKVIAWHRWSDGGPGDDVVIVANFADRAYDSYNVGFPRDGTWHLRFNGDWTGYDASFSNKGYTTTADRIPNQGMPCSGNVGLGPYSAIILSQ